MHICGYVPGSIGRLVELHGRYYARDWRFGRSFEAKVASELGELLARLDPTRDGFWIAAEDDEIVGGIAIDGSHTREAARLRFFIVDGAHRGAGLGGRLMRTALDFAGAPDTNAFFSLHSRDWMRRASCTSATASCSPRSGPTALGESKSPSRDSIFT